MAGKAAKGVGPRVVQRQDRTTNMKLFGGEKLEDQTGQDRQTTLFETKKVAHDRSEKIG
jgi:hypothetical protein